MPGVSKRLGTANFFEREINLHCFISPGVTGYQRQRWMYISMHYIVGLTWNGEIFPIEIDDTEDHV